MARPTCPSCTKPLKSCICEFCCTVNNETDVIILQHPSEVKQAKGTVALLKLSLQQCRTYIGESFEEDHELKEQLALYDKQEIVLLYPSEKADVISFDTFKEPGKNKPKCIIIIDGTWKKSYKIFMLNKFLHDIVHITLPEGTLGRYHARKSPKLNGLSSLEACVYALGIIEKNNEKYKPLLNNFERFNQQLLSFVAQ